MANIITMPLLSDTMTEGRVVAWLKEVGDEVENGEILCEIETDKAVMEQESFYDGYLLHIGVQVGESVPINALLAIIGEEGEDITDALAKAKAGGAKVKETEEVVEEEEKEEVAVTAEAATSDARIKASPLAKKIAETEGVNLAVLAGSGDNGRVIKRDVEAYIKKQETAPAVVAPTPVATPTPKPATPATTSSAFGGESYEDIPTTTMRKVIARRLGESKFTAPHFYLTVEINMGKAMDLRKRLNEFSPVKISFNDLVVKSTAVSLRQHPMVNSSWLGDSIRVNKHINIGVAVGIDEGLLVPVVRHADMKSLSQIGTEVRELAGKAKTRKLQPAEMQGNTFTISNLGMFGIEEFTAIINSPDACILAVGGIIQKAIVVDGELAVGNMMKVTLSCDHRVVDGVVGSKFLNTLKGILEDPIRLLV